MVETPLILASSSPRRRELLEQIGIPFRVHAPTDREEPSRGLSVSQRAKVLAWMKAQEVARQYRSGIVLGADTLVVCGARVLGKPRSGADAARMLRLLSGRTHKVVTGIALVPAPSGKAVVRVAETAVKFRKLSNDEIAAYVRSGEPMDKAGAYAAQGRGASFIEWIRGDFYNVVGLPLSLLVTTLRKVRVESRS